MASVAQREFQNYIINQVTETDMAQYKIKAYYKGLLRKTQIVTGKRMAEAVKRVFMQDYGFKSNEIEVTKITK